MATSGRQILITAALSVGAALLAFPWLAGPKPNPVPARFAADSEGHRVVAQLWRDLEASCRSGDLAEFAALVTPSFLRRLQTRTERAGGRIAGGALAGYASGQGFARLWQRPLAAGAANGDRVAVVVPAAAGRTGTQAVAMVWDGERLLLDAMVHVPDVFADDAAAVAELTATLLRAPTRSPSVK